MAWKSPDQEARRPPQRRPRCRERWWVLPGWAVPASPSST